MIFPHWNRVSVSNRNGPLACPPSFRGGPAGVCGSVGAADRLLTLAALFWGGLKKLAKPFGRAWQLLWRGVVRIPDFKVFLAVAALFAACPRCVFGSESSNSAPETASVAAYADEIPTNGMGVLDDQYQLADGDTINYQVLEDEDDPKVITVTDSGDVEVPYLGRFPAAGKTCKELAWDLKAALEKKYYYQATVIISVNTKISYGVVYLEGGVKSPGPQELPKDDVLTISKAILRAGGFDDFADEKHVRITRKAGNGTNDTFTVNVAAILNKGRTETDPAAKPGDLIFIPEKTVRW